MVGGVNMAIQKVKDENEMTALGGEKLYSGAENPPEEERPVRKALGLPLKKQLVYYRNSHLA